jgi:hypothetical protein
MPRQARVRYLFLPGGAASARPQPEEEAVRAPIARLGDAAAFEREREKWRRASEKMTEIIADIELDNISFEEAIRQYSKAPNAAEGGLAEYTEGVFFQGLKNEKEISDEIMGLERGKIPGGGRVGRVVLHRDGRSVSGSKTRFGRDGAATRTEALP